MRAMRVRMAALAMFAGLVGLVANGAIAQVVRDAKPSQLAEHAEADQVAFDGLQRRLNGLRGMKGSRDPVDAYLLAKAQAWLNFAFDARAQRDAGPTPSLALQESDRLIRLLEGPHLNTDLTTPVIATSMKLRDDLWAAAESMKHHAGFGCAATGIAQFEVQLVQAGNAFRTLGWRHAQPYLSAAVRLAEEAQRSLDQCRVARTVAVASPPATVDQTPSAPINIELPLHVHFAAGRSNVAPASARVLEQVVVALRATPALDIGLTGYADARGCRRCNAKLATSRAKAVKVFLVNSGISERRLSVGANSSFRPALRGESALDQARSRRVEFSLAAGAEIILVAQDADLQIERKK